VAQHAAAARGAWVNLLISADHQTAPAYASPLRRDHAGCRGGHCAKPRSPPAAQAHADGAGPCRAACHRLGRARMLFAAARVRWAGVLGTGDCDCARWAGERCRADLERVRMSYDDRAGAVMRFWTLAANPGAFRVEDNVREQDEELWRTSRKVARGDRVGICKYKGRDNYRGIVRWRLSPGTSRRAAGRSRTCRQHRPMTSCAGMRTRCCCGVSR
jgi:hypothetical protein